MKSMLRTILLTLLASLYFTSAWADEYSDTRKLFENAGASNMFGSAHGYALFPTIGKGGFVIGGAYGKGRVYKGGRHIGDTTMVQGTIGFQAGGRTGRHPRSLAHDAARRLAGSNAARSDVGTSGVP